MRKVATLIVGVAAGVIGVAIYNRLRESAIQSNPEALLDRLAHQIETLESHAVGS